MNNVLVTVADSRLDNRERIRTKGEELRLRIAELRLLGKNDGATDIEVLSLLLEIIIHDLVHGKHETIEDRKKTLYNIARTVTLLSNKAQPGESEKFKEKYTASDERSIWRDIEFLHKMLISQAEINYNNHFIPDYRVKKILEHDIPILAQIVSNELNDALSDAQKQDMRIHYKDTTQLPYIYAIVNYYREEESLQKILEYTDPAFLMQIDPTTLEGRLAIFRILEIIGEYSTKKDLTLITRDSDYDIDWDILVTLRNRLAHHEWYLVYSNVMQDLLKRDMEKILAVDIPFIRQRIEIIWNNHNAAKAKIQINERAFDRAVTDYFTKYPESVSLSDEAKQLITQHCEWLLQNNFINYEQLLNILELLRGDLRIIDLRTILRDYIGRVKLTPEYSDKLKGESLNALQALEEITHSFNQIQGDLTRKTNINKAKEETAKFLKNLVAKGVISKEDFAVIQVQVKDSISLEGLLAILVDIQQQYNFTVDAAVVDVLQQYFKIQENNKKKSDYIRDLYKLLGEKGLLSQDRTAEIGEIIRKIKSGEIPAKDGSAQIDAIKLQVINLYLQTSGLENISRESIELSDSYHKLIVYIKPPISEGLKKSIANFCSSLAQNQVITIDTAEALIKLLQNEQTLDFLLALKQAIGEENFTEEYKEKLKSTEVIQLEQMRQKFGEILENIDKENELFKRQSEKAEKEVKKHKEQYLHYFRVLKDDLPDDEAYKLTKKKQPLFEQLKVLQNAIEAIGLLEQLFNESVFPSLATIQKGFPEERQFLHIPQELWDKIHCEAYTNKKYVMALKKLQEYFKTPNIPIPLKDRLITNEDDIVSSRPVKSNMSEAEAQLYINQNIDYIIRETTDYAHFIEICQMLKANPVLMHAMEYATSVIWPYLSETQQEYLGGMPEMLQRELKAQRNVVKHGNTYVDLLVSDKLDEFLVRYASIFTKDLKPSLIKLIESIIQNKSIARAYHSNPDLWYNDEHIRNLLKYYLPNEDDYAIIAPTVFNNTDLLRSNTIAAVQAAIAGQVAVMPINLHGNHWVGAVINMQHDGTLQVIFNNPFGDRMELEPNAVAFVQTIQAVMHNIDPAVTINIIDLELPQQQNGDDCGVFTTDNLVKLARLAFTHNLDGLSREQIIDIAHLEQPADGSAAEIRPEHNVIFQELNLPIPQVNPIQLQHLVPIFMCHEVIFDNPILNDKKIAELFKLAKLHFGMKGVDRLIGIGLKPQEYQEFQELRKVLGDEISVKFYLDQESRDSRLAINNIETQKNSSSLSLNLKPEIIILDPEGRQLIISDEYGQKLQLQLTHYYLTGELFETAATALQQGYTIFTHSLGSNYLARENLQLTSFNETRSQTVIDYYNPDGERNYSIKTETFNITLDVGEQSNDYSTLLGLLFIIEITAHLSGDLSNLNHVF